MSQKIKNFDKVPDTLKQTVLDHIKNGYTVTINDDGLFMIDMKLDPGFSNAKLK